MCVSLSFTNFIGYFAAGCTTLSFVPQLVKIRKQGGAGLPTQCCPFIWRD